MSNAPIALLQRLFPRHPREPEHTGADNAGRLEHIARYARYGYFNMSYTPLMFPCMAEMRLD